MATTKLFLLIVGLVAQLRAFTPPNDRPPTEQLRELRGREVLLPQDLALLKIILWSWVLLEASVVVALSEHCPPAIARPLLYLLPISLTSSDPTALTTPTPAFIIGTALVLAGAFLRVHCFRALGHQFTFELSIRPEHKLVTHGMYGVVRHPSYTGMLATVAGWFLCLLDPRGVVVTMIAGVFSSGSGVTADGSERGVTSTILLTCMWAMALYRLSLWVSQRMNKEDAMLEKNFGEVWRAWAKRVPYQLVPGVY